MKKTENTFFKIGLQILFRKSSKISISTQQNSFKTKMKMNKKPEPTASY